MPNAPICKVCSQLITGLDMVFADSGAGIVVTRCPRCHHVSHHLDSLSVKTFQKEAGLLDDLKRSLRDIGPAVMAVGAWDLMEAYSQFKKVLNVTLRQQRRQESPLYNPFYASGAKEDEPNYAPDCPVVNKKSVEKKADTDDLLASLSPTLKKMVLAYLEAALWTGTDETTESGGSPLDSHYGIEHFDHEALQKAVNDCKAFLDKAGDVLVSGNAGPEQIGHDFWLTRNGHGAGFWDRPEMYGKEAAEQLTKIAQSFGESNAMLSWGKGDAKISLSMRKTADDWADNNSFKPREEIEHVTNPHPDHYDDAPENTHEVKLALSKVEDFLQAIIPHVVQYALEKQDAEVLKALGHLGTVIREARKTWRLAREQEEEEYEQTYLSQPSAGPMSEGGW